MDGIPITRRAFLTSIGMTAGGVAMYHAMTALGHAGESQFDSPPVLSGARKGTSVLILGAGLAGLSAAYEMQKAGYTVRLLEYQNRPGGRNWTLRGGDTYTELGGLKQTVKFAKGNYFNPGPSRIPYHHRAVLHYCKVLNVPLETFVELNHNAYIHSTKAFGGKPMRFRDLSADMQGGVSELLAKAINAKQLGGPLTAEDQQKLLVALRGWGALDSNFAYKGLKSSTHRGYKRPPGAGIDGAPLASEAIPLQQLLDPTIWGPMNFLAGYNFQTTMFQPVGGIDMIGKGFVRHLKDRITYNAKVTKISQDAKGVTATFTDAVKGGTTAQAKADWCICTLPLPILAQMDLQVSKEMLAVFQAVPYTSYNRIGIEYKRRFWEEDEAIYGGFTSTDLDIQTMHYPNDRFHSSGPAVVVAGYPNRPKNGVLFTGMTPQERIEACLAQGEQIHPQVRKEYMNGVAVSWHRVPWNLGCRARWSEETRKQHYARLVDIDGRIAFAGDSVSYLPGWMEGAFLSALDTIKRVHKRAVEA